MPNNSEDSSITYYYAGEEYEEPIEDAERAVVEVTCPRCGTERTLRKTFDTRESESCGQCGELYLSRHALYGEGFHGRPFESSDDRVGLSPTEFQDEIQFINERRDIRLKGRNASFKDAVLAGISSNIHAIHLLLIPLGVFLSLVFYSGFMVKQFTDGGSIPVAIAITIATGVGLYILITGTNKTLHYVSNRLIADHVSRDDVEPNGVLARDFAGGYMEKLFPFMETR